MSDDNRKACGIVWVLLFWLFALHAPPSREVPVVLLNQPILTLTVL